MTLAGALDFEELLSVRARIDAPRRGGPPTVQPERRAGGAPPAPLFDFGGGRPDPDSYPFADLTEVFARMLAEDGRNALSYGDGMGYLGLRELLVAKFRRHEGIETGVENFLITNGSAHALSLVMSAFLDVGDVVLCEAPTFVGTLIALRRHGPELIGIPLDAEGMRTDVLAEKLEGLRRAGRRAKLIYTIVNFQNPSGPTMSPKRRHELLELAAEHGVVVLEDDAYGELRFEGEARPSLYKLDRHGLVARAGTFSKILGAGVRVGYLLAPAAMVPYVASFKFDGGTSPLVSRLVTWYMREHMDEHIAELIGVYRRKRDAMLAGLEASFAGTDAAWSRPEGGFFIWVKLPRGLTAKEVVSAAAEERVVVVPGPAFMPNGGGEDHIRLAYSFANVGQIEEGIGRLGRVLR